MRVRCDSTSTGPNDRPRSSPRRTWRGQRGRSVEVSLEVTERAQVCDWLTLVRAVALRTSPQLEARPSRHDSTVGSRGLESRRARLLARADWLRELARRARHPTASRSDSRCGTGEIVERNRRVGKPGGIDDVSVLDQSPDGIRHVPDVDVHPGQHPTAAEPERHELASGDVAADHDLVVAAWLGEPDVLHPEVVLVGRSTAGRGSRPPGGRRPPPPAGWSALAQCSTRRCRPKNGW